MRKVGLCANHYQMKRRYGEIRDWFYQWADEANCVVCGRPNGGHRSRRYCSAACQQIVSRLGGVLPPTAVECVRCQAPIDLFPLGQARRIRMDVRLCRRCKSQSRTEATPGELALRDGSFCQLCGCDVDLSACSPDPMRPSVDHIVPRALGGGDEATNNQLTHLLCNQIKSSRLLDIEGRLPLP